MENTLRSIKERIADNRERNLAVLTQELERNGDYETWYEELSDFRKALRPYYAKSFSGKIYKTKRTRLPSEDVLDHHVIGFLAPLDFKRKGWGNRWRTPSEQLIAFDRYCKAHGTRFIYAALPCKGVFYPDLAVPAETLHGRSPNIPQWRKLLRELVCADVDVLDLLPPLMKKKNDVALYTKDHYISPACARLTGELIGDYLKDTVRLPEGTLGLVSEDCEIGFSCPDGAGGSVEAVYPGCRVTRADGGKLEYPQAEIGLFGNCNLQAFMRGSAGIYENLLYSLDAPVEYMGRELPFCTDGRHLLPIFATEGIGSEFLARVIKKDIVIYLGFPSAAFVRSSGFYNGLALPLRLLYGSRYAPWSTTPLD